MKAFTTTENKDISLIIDEFNLIRKQPNYKEIVKRIKTPYSKDLEKFIYYFKVWEQTEINCLMLNDISKRGKDFHIDHIIPISLGFKYGLEPSILGSLKNLRLITLQENLYKNSFVTPLVKEKLKEFNLVLNKPIKREKIFIKKDKGVKSSAPYLISDKHRLTLYPKGNLTK